MCETVSDTNKMIAAVCQMTIGADKRINQNTCIDLINQAANMGSSMVFLPECCDFFIIDERDKIPELAESLHGPFITSMKSIAKNRNVWLSIGSFHEKDEEDHNVYSTHVIIDSSGDTRGVYRKTHLFAMTDILTGMKLNEGDLTSAGKDIGQIVDTPLGKVAMFICYDLRFPEISNVQRQRGAEILTYPSNFTLRTGMSHWSPLLRARAIENQCYVIAAAQTGKISGKNNFECYGHASIIDPWGNVLCECGEGNGVGVAVIDLDYLKKVRTRMPVFEHRRYDLYANPNKGN